MFLYKFEAKGKGFPRSVIVVMAESDVSAFEAADALLERNALGLIEIEEMALVEKKRAEKSSGFVIEEKEDQA